MCKTSIARWTLRLHTLLSSASSMDEKGPEFTWDETLDDGDQNGTVLYKSVRRGAEVFNLYDNVLTTPTVGSKFPLAKIMKLWEDEDGKQMVIRWFYNWEDAKAVGYEGQRISEHEMFLAMGDRGDNGVEDSNSLVSPLRQHPQRF